MAATVVALAPVVIGLVSKFLPSIIQLVHAAHPVPPDATPAVKSDLNSLKASAANQLAAVLINQFATAGGLPASASDPNVQAMLAGAIEQAYQAMKSAGGLSAPSANAVPIPSPIGGTSPTVNILGEWKVIGVRS